MTRPIPVGQRHWERQLNWPLLLLNSFQKALVVLRDHWRCIVGEDGDMGFETDFRIVEWFRHSTWARDILHANRRHPCQ